MIPSGITGEFYQEFKEILAPVFFTLFQRFEEKRRLQTHEAKVNLIPVSDKDTTRKLLTSILDEC